MSENILITGFGPFGEHNVNPSWLVAQELEQQKLGSEYDSKVKIITRELPVDYQQVRKKVPKLWEKYHPLLVVHIGVHSLAKTVILETQAHNSNYIRQDINSCLPDHHCCVLRGPGTLCSKLDLQTICKLFKMEKDTCGVSLELSNDPGRYLCDFTYYSSLYIDSKRVIFVHIPCLDQPYTLHQLTHTLRFIINKLLDQIFETCN